MRKKVPLDDGVGLMLAHDITEIRPGEFKGPAFRRGHKVQAEDLEHLRRLGKSHLYVLEIDEHHVHQDQAAERLALALCGPGVVPAGPPSEGRINLVAEKSGLLLVREQALFEFNLLGEVMCASRHGNVFVRAGQIVAGTRAIPLAAPRSMVERACEIALGAGGVFSIVELVRKRIGLVITGNEICAGLVKDGFVPALQPKIERLGGEMMPAIFCPDDEQRIAAALLELRQAGAELLIAAGGMSVDPDDVTRLGLEKAGAREVSYGAAVLPGAMGLVAYLDGVPVLGAPACVLHATSTVVDLLLPRLMAGLKIGRREMAALGRGGLCLGCAECRFPDCAFGKA